MPYFRVMLHGEGIDLLVEGSTEPAIGFYITRIIRASSPDEATERVRSVIAHEWAMEPYKSSNRGLSPRLTMESVSEATFFDWLTFKKPGYSLYSNDNVENDA
jgi:hypothetical protein